MASFLQSGSPFEGPVPCGGLLSDGLIDTGRTMFGKEIALYSHIPQVGENRAVEQTL